MGGGLEYSQWDQGSGKGSAPSVEEVYTPDTLPGLGAKPTYLQPHATLAFDWRPAADYARRGGYYGATIRSYADQDGPFSFRQVDYEAIQHIPILRDAWVLSLRGRVETTYTKGDEVVPFFMLPALGSGSTLRGFSSWRFRIGTACCSPPNGACSSTASSTPPSSTTPARSRHDAAISTWMG